MSYYPTKLPHLPDGIEASMYEGCAMQPLRITATLDNGYIPHDSSGLVALGSLLSYAFVQKHIVPLGAQDGLRVMPLPVACVWQNIEGLPLWAAGDLAPVTPAYQDRQSMHRRFPQDRMRYGTKLNINQAAGRYKSLRVNHHIVVTPSLTAHAVGDADLIRELLTYAPNVGKRVAAGWGNVLSWNVEVVDGLEPDECIAEALRERPVPIDYYDSLPNGERTAYMSWTPPRWHAPWKAVCRAPTSTRGAQ